MMSEGSEEGAVEDNNRDEVASLDESGAEDGEDIQNSEGEHNQVCIFNISRVFPQPNEISSSD